MPVEGDAENVAEHAERTTDPVEIVQRCAHRGITLVTAESLTAGSLAARIADVPGASAVLLGGVVAYCNEVKQNQLSVSPELLEEKGAVDPVVAASMAQGAAEHLGADLGIATTGVAGPAPHQGKDVGTVYLGLACRGEVAERLSLSLPEHAEPHSDDGTQGWLTGSLLLDLSPSTEDVDNMRAAIRQASVEGALKLIEDFLLTEPAGLPEAVE
ncbi:CinA family protein [Nesterenkonia flava]|uniref:Nicotinamide-nucleotide amidohydrolase family protein n=1 Tax=Nesterenkonia flava TaxID=469799 RepID=A0ABU1FSI8_9MICC|nr:nicotinamide-nucleotide amidohydrolase family protein [Nesterenkonia flava]MDR5711614.1 nicotinamide-nucleotide amidohydrolase family protein [Nesterenkonia flava]